MSFSSIVRMYDFVWPIVPEINDSILFFFNINTSHILTIFDDPVLGLFFLCTLLVYCTA